MNPIQFFFHLIEIAAIYLLYYTVKGLKLRLTVLEKQKPKETVILKAPQPKVEQKPIAKFRPKEVVPVMPEEGKSVEVAPGVYEFR